MVNWSCRSLKSVTLGLVLGTVAPLATSVPNSVLVAPASAQNAFPDVEPSYWAQPFIQSLAARNIITGYPDGTYRPEQPIDRDEFAAIIRQAFNQNEVRQIPSGSVFKDVPVGYWAAPPIEEAYEAGFMRGFNGFFRPQEEVSRVDAIVALIRGLNLSPETPTATQAIVPQATAPQATAPQVTTQAPIRRAAKRPIFFPLAITSLMQPLVIASANARNLPSSQAPAPVASGQAVPPSQTPAPVESGQVVSFNRPPAAIVSKYYTDANQIPQYAIDEVAAATTANIVVNYPNVNVLNPTEPLSRGAAAALFYQTLVRQGKLEPIPGNAEASNYIVGRTQNSNQSTKTAQ